jgi:hypothetical protein
VAELEMRKRDGTTGQYFVSFKSISSKYTPGSLFFFSVSGTVGAFNVSNGEVLRVLDEREIRFIYQEYLRRSPNGRESPNQDAGKDAAPIRQEKEIWRRRYR